MDFLVRWPNFRPRALALGDRLRREGMDADIVDLLVALTDRLGPDDFPSTNTPLVDGNKAVARNRVISPVNPRDR